MSGMMKVDSVDFFYLSMPEILDIGDGSQDALLVRVRSGNEEGWGECEAAPLPTLAAWMCPMSHSACKPVSRSVLGQPLNEIADIARIHQKVRENSLDLLQADHVLSGVDIALWDLMGKRLEQPVYQILGYSKSYPKLAYASQLFGDDPQDTFRKAEVVRQKGYQAAKFGWGPYGRGTLKQDVDHVQAAREGLGSEAYLLIDAGTVWEADVEIASQRLLSLETCKVHWLEEPFVSGAVGAYYQLSTRCRTVKLAGGEGCHNFYQAKILMDYGGLGFIQIDTGRVGGISSAKWIADEANRKGIEFVNHTFTTHLALSASMQPYAGLNKHRFAEYPVEASALAQNLTFHKIDPDVHGQILLPEAPGLGMLPDPKVIREYQVPLKIEIRGKTVYESPEI